MTEKELLARKIKRGVVIDHIPLGKALCVLNILKPDPSAKVFAAFNVDSAKVSKKDMITIEEKSLTSEEFDLISLIAPTATINLIEDWKIMEKQKVKLPKTIDGIFKCPNLSCVTNSVYEPESVKFKVFAASDIENLKLQCMRCNAYLYSGTIMNLLMGKCLGGGKVTRERIEKTLLDVLVRKGALKIAPSSKESFVLKSGRASPYFVNIGTLTDGDSLAKIKWAFASYISILRHEGKLEDFEFIFGPAYKGINLATLACEGLSELYGINRRYLYDRKEEKTYGDVSADKIIVGADHFREGQKILLIDDVITTGGTKLESLDKLKLLGAHKVVGLVLVVDREERMGGVNKVDENSAVGFIREKFGIKVFSILDSKTIFDLVRASLPRDVRQYWIDYYEKYGAIQLQ